MCKNTNKTDIFPKNRSHVIQDQTFNGKTFFRRMTNILPKWQAIIRKMTWHGKNILLFY